MDYNGTVVQLSAVPSVQQRIKTVTLASFSARLDAFRIGIFARGRAWAAAAFLDLSDRATLFNRNAILKMTLHIADGSL